VCDIHIFFTCWVHVYLDDHTFVREGFIISQCSVGIWTSWNVTNRINSDVYITDSQVTTTVKYFLCHTLPRHFVQYQTWSCIVLTVSLGSESGKKASTIGQIVDNPWSARSLACEAQTTHPTPCTRKYCICIVFLLLPFLLEHRASVKHFRFTSVS
jgi:hypothetical protein